ncbi:MAG: tyrosine-type recombinase/integrase [Desulfobacteria bacterium]
MKRIPVKGRKGIFYIVGTSPATGKADRIYYLRFKRGGKLVEEKAGRASEGMTEVKAAAARSLRMTGKEPTNEEKRQAADADKKRMTVSKLAEYYFANRSRKKSDISDRAKFRLHIEPALGNKIPEEIDPLSLDRLRVSLAGKKAARKKGNLSPTTVRHVMALLRQIVNFGVSRGITEGTRKKVPVPPMPGTMVTEDLTDAQLSELIKALDAEADQDAADVVRLVMLTGARRAEVMKLLWDDVDLPRGVWILRDRKDGRTTGFPIPAPAVEILKRREKVRGTSPNVFPGPGEDGHVVDPRAAFRRIHKAAKLPEGFRLLHGLRHRYASALVSSGVDLFVVSKLLGHSTPDLTAKRYAHLRPGVMAEAAELAGRLVNAATIAEGDKAAADE